MSCTELILTPLRPATPIEGGIVDLLIRLQAPDLPGPVGHPVNPPDGRDAIGTVTPPARLKLRLALVIDRSGSMMGEPLAEAVRCAQQLIARLQADDEVAVVLYDGSVEVPIPLQSVAGVSAAAAALTQLRSGGQTALHAGWQAGLAQLGAGQPDAISRVLLLSDGQANIGPSTLDAFAPDLLAALERGLSTTTVGLGSGFNEELMIGLARLGGGQSYYGQTADDLADPFNEEFALLQALCVRQPRLHLTPGAGVQWEPLGDLHANLQTGTLALPDLAFGAEAWAMVRLHLAPATAPETDRRHLLTVRASGIPASADVMLATQPVRLDLPGLPAAMVDALPPDPLVQTRRTETLFSTALAAVHAALRLGHPTAITQALAEAATLADGQPWLLAKLAGIRDLITRDLEMATKEVRYSSRKISARLAAKESSWDDFHTSTASLSVTGEGEGEVPAFLRKKVSEGRG